MGRALTRGARRRLAMLEMPLDDPSLRDAAREEARDLATVCVVGLGYVGLPVAVAFGKQRCTVGFDLASAKVERLKRFEDATGEVSAEELRAATRLGVTDDPARIREADFVIVAVPTPVKPARQPDLAPLESASRIVGENLKRGATVIYESTVYPGATEEICVPILEERSGMRWKQDFHVGYSPERINPGDRAHNFARITKVVSGDDEATLEKVADLYASVVEAGAPPAPSVRLPEAAQGVQDNHRRLHNGLLNELSIIFDRLGID